MANEYTITCSGEFTFIFSDSTGAPFDKVNDFVNEMLPQKIADFLGAEQAIIKDIKVFPSVYSDAEVETPENTENPSEG